MTVLMHTAAAMVESAAAASHAAAAAAFGPARLHAVLPKLAVALRCSAPCGLMLGIDIALHAACQLLQVSVGGQPVLVWNGGKQFIFEHQREKQVQ